MQEEFAIFQKEVINKIAQNCIELSQSPYGNYAVQIVLETYPKEDITPIIESVKGKLIQLSIMKYSSNVIERCLEKALPTTLLSLQKELVESENFLGMVINIIFI